MRAYFYFMFFFCAFLNAQIVSYSGSIADKYAIHLTINLDFNSAYYAYDKYQEEITLIAQKQTGNQLLLKATENAVDGGEEYFNGTFSTDGKTYSGTWTKGNKSLKFNLKRKEIVYAMVIKDSIQVKLPTGNLTKGEFLAMFYLPRNETNKQLVLQTIYNVDSEEELKNKFEQKKINFFEDIHAYSKESVRSSSNYNYQIALVPIYLGHPTDLYAEGVYEYLGGAHGGQQTQYYNFIFDSPPMIIAKDVVFKPDTEDAIGSVIDETVRQKYGIRSNQSLSTGNACLNVEKMPFINNFLLKENGIEFFYNTYQVTPYACGDYKILVPIEKLKPYLNDIGLYDLEDL